MQFTAARSKQAQQAIVAVFFLQGALTVTQLPRIPEIIKQIDVNFSVWGLILGVAGLGGLLGLSVTSRLIAKFGTRRVSLIGSLGVALTIASFGIIHNPWLFFIAQGLNTFMAAIFNIALNSQTVALQKALNRVIIGKFHASWAIGAASSSALSGLLSTFMPLWVHLLLVPGIISLLLIYFVGHMLSTEEDGHGSGRIKAKSVGFFHSPKRVWLLAAGLFTGVTCELTLMDWSAVFSQRALHLGLGASAIPYTAFSTALILGRLCINPLSKRWHLSRIANVAGIFGGLSMAIAVLVGMPVSLVDPGLGLVIVTGCFAFTGLGAAPMVPSFFSLTGNVKGLSAAQVLARMSLVNALAVMIAKIVMGATATAAGVQAVLFYPVVGMIISGVIAGYIASHEKLRLKEKPYPATGAIVIVE